MGSARTIVNPNVRAYTERMTCLLLALALAQTPFVHETVPVLDQLPVIIEIADGGRVVGSFDERNWERKLESESGGGRGGPLTLMMKLDQPWPGGDRTKTITLGVVKGWYRETAREWSARHREGWTKAGYVDHSVGDELYFVWSEEAKFAEKAQAWADEAYPPLNTPPPADSTEQAQAEAIRPGPPRGFAKQWGAHAGIAATGAVLALIVWKALLSE